MPTRTSIAPLRRPPVSCMSGSGKIRTRHHRCAISPPFCARLCCDGTHLSIALRYPILPSASDSGNHSVFATFSRHVITPRAAHPANSRVTQALLGRFHTPTATSDIHARGTPAYDTTAGSSRQRSHHEYRHFPRQDEPDAREEPKNTESAGSKRRAFPARANPGLLAATY
jgi:hypothetical protein